MSIHYPESPVVIKIASARSHGREKRIWKHAIRATKPPRFPLSGLLHYHLASGALLQNNRSWAYGSSPVQKSTISDRMICSSFPPFQNHMCEYPMSECSWEEPKRTVDWMMSSASGQNSLSPTHVGLGTGGRERCQVLSRRLGNWLSILHSSCGFPKL